MHERHDVRLAELTTLRVGGPAASLFEVSHADELVDTVAGVGRHGCLLLGGGSNVVIADGGVDVPVIQVRTLGVEVVRAGGEVELTVAAGESWDALVARAVGEGWSGIEALSGIPGLVGATPIQNVGAYGQEVADTIEGVEVYDRLTARRHWMSNADCAFGYRTSVFKQERDRFVVLNVRIRLAASPVSRTVAYLELARVLGVDVGATAPTAAVRDAVLSLRRGKGMVLDDSDHDTWSAGSFFTNPVLDAGVALPDSAPRWQQPDGDIKTSAAWLIERAGFDKGFGAEVGRGAATLSTKHTLAITNRGDATTAELLTLARTVRDGVRAQFAIDLYPEPTLINCHL